MKLTTTWTNNSSATIANVLKAKLGREPTPAELAQAVKRVLKACAIARSRTVPRLPLANPD